MHSFTTKRLLIRPLQAEDESLFCQLYTDEKVMLHTGGKLCQEDANKAFQRSLRANEGAKTSGKKSVLTWAIICQKEKIIIGTQTLSFLVRPHNTDIIKQAEINGIKQAEIGIVLKSKAQGKGVAKEAIEVLLLYGFHLLALDQINAFYANKNVASRMLFVSLNFTSIPTSQFKSSDYGHQYIESNNYTAKLIA